jgi:hypothetical protein
VCRDRRGQALLVVCVRVVIGSKLVEEVRSFRATTPHLRSEGTSISASWASDGRWSPAVPGGRDLLAGPALPTAAQRAAGLASDPGFNILQSLQSAFTTFVDYLPQLIGALIVLLVGFIIAKLLAEAI